MVGIKILNQYKSIFFALCLVVLSGVLGGFLAATALILVCLIALKKDNRLYFLLAALMLVFTLADNFDDFLSFAQNLRFAILGIALLFLLKHKLFQNNKGRLIIWFSAYAFVITLLYSSLGLPALLRSVGFLAVALVIFKLMQILLEKDRQACIDLILTLLFAYFLVNVVLFVIPVYEDAFFKGRFSGLMGNPNGLALLSAFSYALLHWMQKNEVSRYTNSYFKFFKIVLFVIIVLTGSRTSLIALLSFILVMSFYKHKILLILSLSGLAMYAIFFQEIKMEDVAQFLGLTEYLRIESLANASGRSEVWQVTVNEFLKQPWLGQGMLYDDYFISNYAEQRFGANYARNWNKVWSSYLSLALDVGIIGIILFGIFWQRLFAFSKNKLFATAFLLMLLLTAVTESWMAASMNSFMPLVFVIWALQFKVAKQNNKQPQQQYMIDEPNFYKESFT